MFGSPVYRVQLDIFTFSKIMNKIISTKKRVFISLVGPSGSGNLLISSTLSISLHTNVEKYKEH